MLIRWINFFTVNVDETAGNIQYAKRKVSCFVYCMFPLFLNVFQIIASNPETAISGIVKDSLSGLPLSHVSVYFENTHAIITDNEGFFEISNNEGFLIFSLLGYETEKLFIKSDKNIKLEIYLKPIEYQVQEVVVNPKKEKYSKKYNPAIELIEKVIANKNRNRIESRQAWQFFQYEKLSLSFSNIDNAFETKGLTKVFKFLPEYLATSEFDNSHILTLSIKEVASDEYRKSDPENKKSIIRAEKREGLDHLMQQESLDAVYSEAFREINIFENDIEILMKRFVSPLSSTLATSFYKYYILDTIAYKNDRCILLDFAPYNVQDFGFTGRLWVLLDGSYAIKKVEFNIPLNNTVNFVKQMRIIQDFECHFSGLWTKSEESVIADLEAYKYALGIYAKKTVKYANYIIDSVPQSVFEFENQSIKRAEIFNQPDSVWDIYRLVPLRKNEQDVNDVLVKMANVKGFNYFMEFMKILTTGYIRTSTAQGKNIFDIGPVGTLISGNPLEGTRFHLGGMTTANLNKHLFLNGYVAYGMKDRVFKYSSTLTYAFNEKKYHENEYRKNNIAFNYSYDVNTPGEIYSYVNKDNILLSIKRGNNNQMTYRRQLLASYEYETKSDFSFKIWTNNQNEEAAGNMRFLTKDITGNIIDVGNYTNAAVGFRLRLAKNEKIFQNRSVRFSFDRTNPVFTLSYIAGIKGYFGGEYNYQALEVSAWKRFWFSAYGNVDIIGKAGNIWGKLPFPLLMIPNANQAYFMQPESFSLMNALEFVNDKYASLHLEFHFNGILFNRIPFLRQLKLREVIGFNGIYGNLSDKNNPSINTELFIFPEGTRRMTDIPYMEANIGVENILKIFRICYVRRFTYLDNPGISKAGFRFAFTFAF